MDSASSPSSSDPYSKETRIHPSPSWRIPTRRVGCKRLILASLATACLFALFYFTAETSHLVPAPAVAPVLQPESRVFPKPVSRLVPNSESHHIPDLSIKRDPLDPLASLNGPPAMTFRENLRNDTQYISSWISAGWTNDVMTYGNLIYLALITDRIPIMGKFTPSHVGGHVTPIPFGEVFDVRRLRRSLGKPVLEWHEVKDEKSNVIEDIGCWNVWEATQTHEKFARRSRVPIDLGLDISYTLAPAWIKIFPQFPNDFHAHFFSLAALSFPHFRNQYLQTPNPSPLHQTSLPPDEHLLCFDYLYYVSASQSFEYDYDFSPAWRRVAQFMRWTPSLEALADAYVRTTISVPDGKLTPPYVAIHVRHNDFKNWCGDVPQQDCYASIPVIARRVREVQDELRERKQIDAPYVIMTSDEKDPAWWAEVKAQGWYGVDHSATSQTYGAWYPVLIDAVIQSNGDGFVGTDRSTMSVLARRRVESWRDGVTRTVKWGWATADDH